MVQPTITPASAAMLLVLAALWGGSFFFAEIAVEEVPTMTLTMLRVGLALPVLWLVVRARGLALPRGARIWGAYLVMGALNNALPFSLIFWGQTRIDGGLAAILNGTTAVLTAVVAGALLKDERLRPRKVAGAALGLAGVAVVVGPDLLRGLDPHNFGQLAIIGAALSYAFATVWGKVALRGIPAQVNAFGMVAGSFALMLPLALWVDGVPRPDWSGPAWGSVLALAILSTAVAYQLYFAILVRAGAANVMLVTLMVPAFAVALGHVFLDERLPASAYLGFAVIAAGIVVTDGRLPRLLWRAGLARRAPTGETASERQKET